jgi:hypothetical protein
LICVVLAFGASAFPAEVGADSPPLKGTVGEASSVDSEGNVVRVSVTPEIAVEKDIDVEAIFERLAAQDLEIPRPDLSGKRAFRTRQQRNEERRHEVLDFVAPLDDEELVDLVIDLQEMPFKELTNLHGMSETLRQATMDERERSVRAAQQSFTNYATSHGAKVESLWFRNQVRVIAPAMAVGRIMDHQDVRAVYPAWQRFEPTLDGDGIRDAIRLKDLVAGGLHGETGGRLNNSYGGDNIKIAIMEGIGHPIEDELLNFRINRLNTVHRGWLD